MIEIEELVAAWREGDRAAGDEIVNRFAGMLWNFALGMLRSPHDAEEAVQETFIRCQRSLHLWRPGKAKFRTWLCEICKNICLDKLRGEQRRRTHLSRLARLVDLTQKPPAEPASPCELHSPRWFDRTVLDEIDGIVTRIGRTRAGYLRTPGAHHADADRAALSRSRLKIARALRLPVKGKKCTLAVAREIELAIRCGKLKEDLFP